MIVTIMETIMEREKKRILYLKRKYFKLIWVVDHSREKNLSTIIKLKKKRKNMNVLNKNLNPLKIIIDLSKILVY